ncbi:unnamed protein product, partial [Discosporangium mesarthrocarpum]
FPRKFQWSETASLAKRYDLCATGPVLKKALDIHPDSRRFLEHFRVLARMTPDLKEELAGALKAAGRTVLMCGDGSNDVGALKKSDVGLALLSGFGNTNTAPQTPTAGSGDDEGDGGRGDGPGLGLGSGLGSETAGGGEEGAGGRQQRGPGLQSMSDKDVRAAERLQFQGDLEEIYEGLKADGVSPVPAVWQAVREAKKMAKERKKKRRTFGGSAVAMYGAGARAGGAGRGDGAG